MASIIYKIREYKTITVEFGYQQYSTISNLIQSQILFCINFVLLHISKCSCAKIELLIAEHYCNNPSNTPIYRKNTSFSLENSLERSEQRPPAVMIQHSSYQTAGPARVPARLVLSH